MTYLLLARAQGLTPEYLDLFAGALRPGVPAEAVDITRMRGYGDADNGVLASTSNQISMEFCYNGGAPSGLSTRVLAKRSLTAAMKCVNPELDSLFENGMLYYSQLRPRSVAPAGLDDGWRS